MAPPALDRALLAAAGALRSAAGQLNELDSHAGDGDLGITMSEAARILSEVVAGADEMDPAKLLSTCGAAIARGAPSTSGTLVATGFLRASKALAERPQAPAVEALEKCFSAAEEVISARGKASVGDRTLVDGLDAVSRSLRASLSEGAQAADALARAAAAAEEAAAATAEMTPKVGRASWVAERALGHPDAGCTMLAIALKAASCSYSGSG